MNVRSLCGSVIALSLIGGAGAAAAPKTSVSPTGLRTLSTVSHTGRYVIGDGVVLDRETGTRAPAAWQVPGGTATAQFVRDNVALTLERSPLVEVQGAGGALVGIRSGAVWLNNAANGQRERVDADAAGNALTPDYVAYQDDEEPTLAGNPNIVIAAGSVSQDGTVVAFCANYQTPDQFTLYVKNLQTGALTVRPEQCGAGGPTPGGEHAQVAAPEVSADGAVIHLRGAVYADGPGDPDSYFYSDTLVYPAANVPTRTVNGNGSMTRDGKSLFLRRGTHPHGQKDSGAGQTGVYNTKTAKLTKLTGKGKIYGHDALWFSAADNASIKGRYVLYGNKLAVRDRTKGKTYDYGKTMKSRGAPGDKVWTYMPKLTAPLISGDGTTIFARSAGMFVAVDWK